MPPVTNEQEEKWDQGWYGCSSEEKKIFPVREPNPGRLALILPVYYQETLLDFTYMIK
jgi:hypothetical protein